MAVPRGGTENKLKTVTQIFHIHCGCGSKHRRSGRIGLAFGLPTLKEKASNMVQLEITNRQKIKLTLNPDAPLDGKPEWKTVSGASTTRVAEDGLSAELVSEDGEGVSEFVVSADADRGAGVETLSETIRLSVTARASTLGIIVGNPEPKEISPPS